MATKIVTKNRAKKISILFENGDESGSQRYSINVYSIDLAK